MHESWNSSSSQSAGSGLPQLQRSCGLNVLRGRHSAAQEICWASRGIRRSAEMPANRPPFCRNTGSCVSLFKVYIIKQAGMDFPFSAVMSGPSFSSAVYMVRVLCSHQHRH